MSAGDIHLAAWFVACVVMLLYQFVTRQLAVPEPVAEPLWERDTMSLFEATNRRLSCPLPEEVKR